mgnify:CR=1 FL=1
MGMGETSIPCREETRDRLSDLRGNEYKSWDAFLNHLADEFNGDGADVSGLDSMGRSIETVEERTGRIERLLEDLTR